MPARLTVGGAEPQQHVFEAPQARLVDAHVWNSRQRCRRRRLPWGPSLLLLLLLPLLPLVQPAADDAAGQGVLAGDPKLGPRRPAAHDGGLAAAAAAVGPGGSCQEVGMEPAGILQLSSVHLHAGGKSCTAGKIRHSRHSRQRRDVRGVPASIPQLSWGRLPVEWGCHQAGSSL